MKIYIFIVYLLIISVLCSCNKIRNNTEKAKILIDDTLKVSLDDYKSYQSVSWGKLDSLKTSSDSDPNIIRLASQSHFYDDMCKRAQQGMIDALYYQDGDMYRKNYYIATKSLKIINEIVDSIKYYNKRFKPRFIGYRITHKFRTNNTFGKSQMYNYVFFFNKNVTKIDSFAVQIKEKYKI